MKLTLGQAAKQVGVSKPTLSKAIKSGKLSADKREDGSYSIDPAELQRYQEANKHRFPKATGQPLQLETPEETPVTPSDDTVKELLEKLHDKEVEALRMIIAEKDKRIADLEKDKDEWREQARQLLLTDQRRQKQGFFAGLFGRKEAS